MHKSHTLHMNITIDNTLKRFLKMQTVTMLRVKKNFHITKECSDSVRTKKL